jgi:hypothetical protein
MGILCKKEMTLITLFAAMLLILTGCTSNTREFESSSTCLAKGFNDKWGWCINPESPQMVGTRCSCTCRSSTAKNNGQSVPGKVISPRERWKYSPIRDECKY